MKVLNISPETQMSKAMYQEIQSKYPVSGSSKERTMFIDSLNEIVKKDTKGRIESLLAEIDQQSSILAKTPNYKELIKYKNLVKEFLSLVIRDAYGIRYDSGSSSGYRHKSYVLVEINQKLEELTREVLNGEAEPMLIVERVGEIKGLLIDVMS